MPTREKIILTRQQLYDLVWSKPMRILAKELDMSDVALGKWCKKGNVPRPGVGYWQKLGAGKTVKRPPLPDPELKDELHICVTRYAPGEEPVVPPPREVSEYEVLENQPEHRIKVPDRLLRPHPHISQAQRVLLKKNVDRRYGWIYPTNRPCLEIRVSPETLGRALRIMDALIKALETRGIKVDVLKEEWKEPTYALVKGETIKFGIFESPQKGERFDKWSRKMEPAMVPSGKLVLRIRGQYYGDSYQIRDQKRRTVEERLNEFVIDLFREAETLKADRAEREQMRREAEEERRCQEELRKLQEAEEAKVQQLYGFVKNWCKARDIRLYLEAVREVYAGMGGIEDGSNLAKWLEWAALHADKIDPLVPSK